MYIFLASVKICSIPSNISSMSHSLNSFQSTFSTCFLIYTYKTWILYVCLFAFSKKKSQAHEILALGLLWANFDHYDARFSKFWFLRILWAFFVFFKWAFSCFFPKISAMLTPRTMKFGHKEYLYTKKWHQKISFFFLSFPIFKILIFKGGPHMVQC